MADDWRTPDAEALFEAILSLETLDEAERFFRDLCTLGELHDMAQRWAVVRLLDAGQALRRDLARDRRQHGDDHAHRLVAPPRRGRLPRPMLAKVGADRGRRRHRLGPPMTERLRLAVPNKGRMVEPTLRLLHDAGLVFEEHERSLVVARPELRPRHPVRADQRRHRVRRRRRRRPRHHRHRPADRDRRRAAARPRAGLRPLSARGRGPDRQPVPDRRGPGRASRRDGPPEHGPALLRRARHRRRRRARSPARSRSRPGSVWPRRSSTSCRPGSTLVMNGLRQVGDVLASEAVLVGQPDRPAATARDELAAIDTMLSAVIAGTRPQVPDDERAGARTSPSSRPPAGPRVADRHPARARGHGRRPHGRRRGRGLGPPRPA